MATYTDFSEAFASELGTLARVGHIAEPVIDPASPASNFGARPRSSIELFGTSFTVIDIHKNIVACEEIPFNLTYGVGLLLWCLCGSEDQEFISYYRAKPMAGRKVSFGERLQRAGGKHDLLKLAVDKIRLDPGTRRGYAPIFQVDDLFKHGEIPCAIGFHLHQRSGALHCVTLMRAQNAITALPMDVFIFSSVLRFLAADADYLEGTYTHVCSTFHAFADDVQDVSHVLKVGHSAVSGLGLGSMKHFASDLPDLLKFEQRLRLAALSKSAPEIQALAKGYVAHRSEAATIIAACLISVAMRRIGELNWSHNSLQPSLAALIQ